MTPMLEQVPACPDCAAGIGEAHDDGCDVAVCLTTGEQRIQCDGYEGRLVEADDGHLTYINQGVEHDCGQQTWTGYWPGKLECVEFGWWCQDRTSEGLGFVHCAPDAPGARPDLNRLGLDTVWDPKACRRRKRQGR